MPYKGKIWNKTEEGCKIGGRGRGEGGWGKKSFSSILIEDYMLFNDGAPPAPPPAKK